MWPWPLCADAGCPGRLCLWLRRYVGSYLLDVNRMAISMVLVARDNGLDTSQARQMVKAFAANYTDRVSAG